MKKPLKWISSTALVLTIFYCLACISLTPSLREFLEQEKCPACYGQSLCPTLTSPDNEIVLINNKWNIVSLLNVRNVHFGLIESNDVVFKKLGHNWELEKFDSDVCEMYDVISGQNEPICNTKRVLQQIVQHYKGSVYDVIKNYPDVFESSDAVKCISGHHHIVDLLLRKFSERDRSHDVKENFLTVMAINPEPIILMAFGEDEPTLPPLLGACGRVVVEQYVGEPLAHFVNSAWIRRANFTVQLLQLARRLSDGAIRLYLTDPTPYNFVVDKQDKVWLADAENVVLVDSETPLLDSRVHVNDGLGCKDCLSFSLDDLCQHRSADHNFFAICKSLLSSTPFESALPGGLLVNPPPWVTEVAPSLFELVELCSYPRNTLAYEKLSAGRDRAKPSEDLTKNIERGRSVSVGDEATVSGVEDGMANKKVILGDTMLEPVKTRRQAAQMLEKILEQLIMEETDGTSSVRGVLHDNEL